MLGKKVLFFIGDLGGGGAERVFVNLANGFAANGIETILLVGSKDNNAYQALLNRTVQFKVLGFDTYKASNIVRTAFHLNKTIKAEKITHVFSAGNYQSAAAVLACKFSNAKSIVTLHYNLPYVLSVLSKTSRTWVKFINTFILKKANAIVGVSQGVTNGFAAVTKCKDDQLQTIYNPVFNDEIFEWANESVDEPMLFEKLSILVVGRLLPQKNPQRMLRVFEKVSKIMPDANLIFLGQGDLLNELQVLTKQLGIEHNVHFLGFKKNPYAYIEKANVLALSSDYEGLPTVLIEALALGTNVVSTNCPSGPSEILDNGRLGWLVEMNDEKAFAEKLVEAIRQPKDKSLLKQGSIKYHSNIVVKEYIRLLN